MATASMFSGAAWVAIFPPDSPTRSSEPWLTRILWTRGNSIGVAFPVAAQKSPEIRQARALDVQVATRRGVFAFQATIAKVEGAETIVLDVPTENKAITMRQRRHHMRVDVRFPVAFLVNDGTNDTTYMCSALDLSAGGLRLRLDTGAPPAKGTTGRLDFRLSDNASGAKKKRIVCMGTVVRRLRATQGEFTISLSQIASADRDVIDGYVQARVLSQAQSLVPQKGR